MTVQRLVVFLAASTTLGVCPPLRAGIDEPPLVGQPEHFCGAVGVFKAAAEARPTEVRLGDSTTFILRITSTGTASQPPRRPDLGRLPKFKSRFQIQDLAADDRTQPVADGQQWEFHYRLRPLGAGVSEIPALRVDYYKPGSVPNYKGYRATYTHLIPLRVLSTPQPAAARPPAPDWMRRLAEGDSLLRREEPPALPSALVLALLAALPPFGCVAWYAVWRKANPDAAAAARRKRSRAARIALAALHADGRPDADGRTKHVARVVQTYLWQRLDVQPGEAAPEAVSARLRRAGYADELAEQVADFFRTCDAARFAATPAPAAAKLPATAENLILALESEP